MFTQSREYIEWTKMALVTHVIFLSEETRQKNQKPDQPFMSFEVREDGGVEEGGGGGGGIGEGGEEKIRAP